MRYVALTSPIYLAQTNKLLDQLCLSQGTSPGESLPLTPYSRSFERSDDQRAHRRQAGGAGASPASLIPTINNPTYAQNSEAM